MGAESPEIAVGTARGGLYLGLRGRATQRTCPTTNRLVDDYLASRPQTPIVVVDLSGCEWVDSTFAGWLLGLSGRIAPMANGAMLVAGCVECCRKSLERMGLADRLQFEKVEPPDETQIIHCTASDQLTAEELKLMLAAHEALVALGPENERIFAPIVAALRTQLEGS
jgi:anti-anti-sigma regulatory factor